MKTNARNKRDNFPWNRQWENMQLNNEHSKAIHSRMNKMLFAMEEGEENDQKKKNERIVMGISYYFDWMWFEIPVSVSWTEVSISLLRPAKYVTVDWFQSLPNFAASPSPAEITILRTNTVNWINFIGFVNVSVCNYCAKGERMYALVVVFLIEILYGTHRHTHTNNKNLINRWFK